MSSPTLHPNMSDMVLLVHATLQWHSMGEMQSKCFTLGDIFSTALKQLTDTRFLQERFLLRPLRLPSAASTTTRSSSTADAAAACSHHPPSFLASLHRCRGGETPSVLPSSSGPAPLLQLPLFLHPLLPSLPPVDWLTPLLCALAYPPRQSTHSVAEPRFTGEPLWNHGGQMRERERKRERRMRVRAKLSSVGV